jgi:uncharacterized protein (TIGR00369 family)
MSNDEHFRKLERMYAAAPINAVHPPQLRVGHGEAEVRLALRPELHHSAGATHGSVYFRALDDATFFAANSLVSDVLVLTAHFELELLRPVVTGEVRAVARVTEQLERRITAAGELFDGASNLIARGRGSFARSKIALTAAVRYA